MKKLIFSLAILFAQSCAIKTTVELARYKTPTPPQATITVTEVLDTVNAEYIGTVKVGDSGFTTGCTYSDVMAELDRQARAMGGNCIVIKEHRTPDKKSTCHRITALIYLAK